MEPEIKGVSLSLQECYDIQFACKHAMTFEARKEDPDFDYIVKLSYVYTRMQRFIEIINKDFPGKKG